MSQLAQEIMGHQSVDFSGGHSGACSQDLQPKITKSHSLRRIKGISIQDIEH
ncbi:MAG: hypothetical protein Q8K77_02775 [Thermodesulfovibrionales bacterium]|nr:hypothetical protein [Thermodesulfovibrionales bacterium]